MAKEQVTVPDIGGAEGAEVIELLVAVGDEVVEEQGLLVLESDKASMEIPTLVAGTVVELLVSEGQELSEGSPIAVIETAGDSSAEPAAESAAGDKPSAVATEDAGQSAPTEPEPSDSAAPAAVASESPPASEEKLVAVPDIGTDEAVDLTEISVAVGDTVSEGDSLVVLESDKASMEVPAPFGGEVVRILVEEGAAVREGDELLVLRVAGQAADSGGKPDAGEAGAQRAAPEAPAAAPAAAASAVAGTPAAASAAAGTPAAASAAAGTPAAGTPAAGTPAAGTPAAAPAAAASAAATPPPADGGADKRLVYAGPAVRKLARELGVDLGQVSGSGPRGRLVKEDLHAYVQAAMKNRTSAAPAAAGAGIPAVPEPDFAAFGPIEEIDRSKLDKLTAANMHRSWLNVPHVTQFDDADITDLEAFRNSLKSEAEARGTRLTPLPFILKACAVALRDHPKFRASLADGGAKLVYKQYTHIGMAVDTPAGLLVPVIRDVDQKSLWELAEEVPELAARARDRKLKPAEMQGGCFTISSLGGIGGNGFTPIVNTPEVGILGVSRAEIKPVWDGESFQPRKLLPLALSYDHRVINGGDGGRFLTQLVALLGDIRRLAL